MQNFYNRNFQDLFKEKKYLALKNYLYNYLLRKRAVEKCLLSENPQRVLEIGSGISPLTTRSGHTIYSDVSYEGVRFAKKHQKMGLYVVADAVHLPFQPGMFSHVICSEVLEHIEDDRSALEELARVLHKPSGCLILTVPHRKCYFANDDRFVKHYRRYERAEIKYKLLSAGFRPILTRKVLGPMEKITMSFAVYLYSIFQKFERSEGKSLDRGRMQLANVFFKWANIFYKGFVWLDSSLMPFSFSSVILIKSVVSESAKPKAHFGHDKKRKKN